MKIPLAPQPYTSPSLPWASQRLVNLYAEIAPPGVNAKTEFTLFPTPGLVSFATAGSGPIRGAIEMGGTVYAVSGTTLYSVTSGGAATSLGTVLGSGPVSMAHNGTQLCIATDPTGYVYSVSGGLAQITDADYPGAATVLYMDGYGIFIPSDAQTFYVTSLLDFTSVDALDFASAEGAPDDLVGGIVDHRELWLFGAKTVEVWVNTGAADFPFARIDGAFMERGCAARFSIVKEDNTVFWLGDDRVFYRADGYRPVRISTAAIEGAVSGYSDVSDCEAFAYTDRGHKFIIFRFPTGNATWVYDVSTGLWHERKTGVADGQWAARWHARAFDKHLVGSIADGSIYYLSDTTYADDGETTQRMVDISFPNTENKRFFVGSFVLDVETGVGLTSGQGSDPQVMLKWSDDGGRTWGNEHWRSFGQIGEYRKRVTWYRQGQARQRIYRVTLADPVKFAPCGAYVEATVGAS